MITLLVLIYTYMVWLFTAYNPMPHLSPSLIVVVIPETVLELLFIIFVSSIAETIFKRPSQDRWQNDKEK